MAYEFPSVEREIYPKTFLKDVRMLLSFPAFSHVESINEKLEDFFDSTFGLKEVCYEDIEKKKINVYSKVGKIRFNFDVTSIELIIGQPTYNSFEDTEKYRQIAFDFLSLLGYEKIDKVVLSKYNQLSYKSIGNDVTSVMTNVFSSWLLENMTEEDKKVQTSLARWEKTLNYHGDDETESMFTIEYGFKRKSVDQEKDALTLKTQIESQKAYIEIKSLKTLLEEYNQILDNGFHYCISENVKKLMKEE